MIELMLDIETLSTRVNAHILQVAVVPFDLEAAVIGTNTFNMHASGAGQDGRHIDRATVRWWMDQDDEVSTRVLFARKMYPLGTVLSELYRYVRDFSDETRIWCKGPEFDTACLKHAFEAVGMDTPWSFRYVRDVRTATEVSHESTPRPGGFGATHDAEDDCINQIEDLYWHLHSLTGFAREQLA